MRSLILFRDDKSAFDQSEIASVARTINGADSFSDDGSDFCTLKFHYRTHSDQTIARLSKDRKTVEIAGTGIASQRIAWAIQERVRQPLHVIDTDYSFDIELWTCDCFEDFSTTVEGI